MVYFATPLIDFFNMSYFTITKTNALFLQFYKSPTTQVRTVHIFVPNPIISPSQPQPYSRTLIINVFLQLSGGQVLCDVLFLTSPRDPSKEGNVQEGTRKDVTPLR